MLDGKNLRVERPSAKLSDKFYGPYEVVKKLGSLDYQLKLPKSMRIHPVFHVQLLHRHHKNTIPGRVQPEPQPVVIDGEQEWEVEKILDSRFFRRRFEYLIKWLNFDEHHNSWQPLRDVEHAKEAIEDFHREFPSAPRPLAKKVFASIPFTPLVNLTESSSPVDAWYAGIGRRDAAP